MLYIKLPNTYPYRIERFRADHPGTSFPAELQDRHYADHGVLPVAPTTAPAHDPITQDLSTYAENVEGEWVQRWTVSEASEADIAQRRAARVPASVTMRQARLALLGAGKLALVDAAISSMKEPQQSAARIEWEYSGEVQRHNGFVAALGPALGLTSEQIDALFIAAAKL